MLSEVHLATGLAVAQPEDRLRPVGVHEVDREVAAGHELELPSVVEDRVVGLAGAEGVAGVGGHPVIAGQAVQLVGLELLGADDVDAEGRGSGPTAPGLRALARAGSSRGRRRGAVCWLPSTLKEPIWKVIVWRAASRSAARRSAASIWALVLWTMTPAGHDLRRLRASWCGVPPGGVAVRASAAQTADGRGSAGGRAACAASWHGAHQGLLRSEAQRRVGGRRASRLASSPTVTTTAVATHTRRTVTRGRTDPKGLPPRRRR